jgi:hypothetical protein
MVGEDQSHRLGGLDWQDGRRIGRKPSAPHLPRACAIACCASLILLLAGCSGTITSSHCCPNDFLFLTFEASFAPEVSYTHALRLVTDLGLQPGIECIPVEGGEGEPHQTVRWQPYGQRDVYGSTNQLLVYPVSTPNDWVQQLKATTGVLAITIGYPQWPGLPTYRHRPDGSVMYACLAPVDERTLSPQTPVPILDGVAYARVTFGDPLPSYDAALYTIGDFGLALADPCLDQAVKHPVFGQQAIWHPMGQATAFASGRQLIVKTSPLITSSLWQRQLQATPGVASVETPYTPQCQILPTATTIRPPTSP